MSAVVAAPPPYGRTVARYCLGWLAAANLVGVWLALSLLWPALGNALAPLTFGRWAPLHLDWQLYGWCSLPLVGALFAWYLDPADSRATRDARLALFVWSLALLLGGASWLAGNVSGKLFLDWHGWARPLLPAAMVVLWGVLARQTWRRWPMLPPLARAGRAGLLALLAVVPGVLFHTLSRDIYQPINPDSGGATGAALLGSTLGIVAIFMLVPLWLGLRTRRPVRWFYAVLGLGWLVFATVDRGYVSHHVRGTVLTLTTLFLWIPLLPLFWRHHAWPDSARIWLRAAAVWWAVLILTGWITYLPGISERLKFTHAMVGHAHLAMAGLVTCVHAAILTVLTGRPAPRGVFLAWQAGCAVYVGSMVVLGVQEVPHMAELFRSEPWTQALFATRLVAGASMTAAAIRWWVDALAR